MTEIGGIKTRWLFPNDLVNGNKLTVQISGEKEHLCKGGIKMPIVELFGHDHNGNPGEWMCSVWSISSKDKIDTKDGKTIFEVTKHSESQVWFKPVASVTP
jgi:hypothetical protein